VIRAVLRSSALARAQSSLPDGPGEWWKDTASVLLPIRLRRIIRRTPWPPPQTPSSATAEPNVTAARPVETKGGAGTEQQPAGHDAPSCASSEDGETGEDAGSRRACRPDALACHATPRTVGPSRGPS